MPVRVKIVALGHSVREVEVGSASVEEALRLTGFSLAGIEVHVWRGGKKSSPPLEDGDIITIVPAGGIRGEATIKAAGHVWRVHQNDADPFPSNLHAHCQDRPEILDLYTGNVYDARTRTCIRRMRQKDLEEIWGYLPQRLHRQASGS